MYDIVLVDAFLHIYSDWWYIICLYPISPHHRLLAHTQAGTRAGSHRLSRARLSRDLLSVRDLGGYLLCLRATYIPNHITSSTGYQGDV